MDFVQHASVLFDRQYDGCWFMDDKLQWLGGSQWEVREKAGTVISVHLSVYHFMKQMLIIFRRLPPWGYK